MLPADSLSGSSPWPGRDGERTPHPRRGSILVVDDDAVVRRVLARALDVDGWEVTQAAGFEEGRALATSTREAPDVALIDLRMPDGDGVTLAELVRAEHPETVTIIMTGAGTIESAVDAMRRGVYDYLLKPFEHEWALASTLARALEHKRLRDRSRFLESRLGINERFAGLVGASAALRAALATVDAVARTVATVLLRGESGTGKELLARAIHDRSPRAARPFVALDCGALTESLLESELFGHARGAFTGATSARRGIFEEAAGGTVFLDEIGELPLAMQPRLLRVLQEREVRPVGTNVARPVDVRVVAATHRSLAEEVDAGRFRQDLYYRLAVVEIEVPPLRDRSGDVPLLAHHFVRKHAARHGVAVDGITPEALDTLCECSWPGNVRQLENAIERAVVLTRSGPVEADALPNEVRRSRPTPAPTAELASLPLREALRAFEHRYLAEALRACDGNIAQAARAIGVDRSNLSRLLRRHGLRSDG